MDIVLLTSTAQSTTEVLPALGLLAHRVTVLPCDASRLLDRTLGDAVLLDARRDLSSVKAFSRILTSLAGDTPVIAVLTEGGLVALSAEWSVDDVILDSAGPAELDARLRLAVARHGTEADDSDPAVIRVGDLTIDETTYSARVRTSALDLTYKEFELLKFLAQHPSRVFTRARLLQEVWGYDYFGGTRTVDVHVRRLRAKLGPEREAFIGTVRNVGYKFVPPTAAHQSSLDAMGDAADSLEADSMDTESGTGVTVHR
jgi:DNA-binding response OmpR family regulator